MTIFYKKIVTQYAVEPDTLICHFMNAYAILLVVENQKAIRYSAYNNIDY